LHERLREEFAGLQVEAEIIFIDDGSTDGSRELLHDLAATDPRCRVVLFRRNCGKAAALQTGFRLAEGQYILTLDADLQDDPAEIPKFLAALQQADVVSGWKAERHDPLGKTFPSKIFNAVVRRFTGVNLHDMNCGWKGYRREVVQEITLYGELHRFIPALAASRGFSITEVIVTHHPRRSGKSKYGWERFLRGMLDLLTVVYLMKYRARPLHLMGGLGCMFTLVGLVLIGVLTAIVVSAGSPLPAWHVGLWLLPLALVIIGPVFIATGLLAEALLAHTLSNNPQPPVAEWLNTHSTPGHSRYQS
jgi:glycosyltransferase involved in cell wall biosynthesis